MCARPVVTTPGENRGDRGRGNERAETPPGHHRRPRTDRAMKNGCWHDNASTTTNVMGRIPSQHECLRVMKIVGVVCCNGADCAADVSMWPARWTDVVCATR